MLWKRYVVNLDSFSLSDYKTAKYQNGCLGFQNNLKLIYKQLIINKINSNTFYILHPTFYNYGNPLAFPNPTARVGLSATIFFVEDVSQFNWNISQPQKRISTTIPIAGFAIETKFSPTITH
ncbi:hypothetical protein IO89_06060 [Epilithonimonas lactis]|uniref:Uncharacterized protein n=1 Tax=Epilithonimonas lactis TaxID=421072 RepID=A0A085BJH1_9FLAO|nr:hypothetical protein IO89_06060 [Epilithonimonas lactis]